MLNVIGGARPIAFLNAFTRLFFTCVFPHDVSLHRMSSRYLMYISFLKNSLVHDHYGDSNQRPYEIQVSRPPTEPPTLTILLLEVEKLLKSFVVHEILPKLTLRSVHIQSLKHMT